MAGKKPPSLFPETKESCPSIRLEARYFEDGFARIAGVDEAGRGPLAGPVVAAAVVLPASIPDLSPLFRLRDSKVLQPEQRAVLYELVVREAADLGWGMCDNREIDDTDILAASLEAMRRAIESLDPPPDLCLIDGNRPVPCRTPQVTVVKGDRLCLSIAAASIVAKVIRDQIMEGMEKKYPGYGLALHKGYATAFHKTAIADLGPSPIHRRTFKGVRECLEK